MLEISGFVLEEIYKTHTNQVLLKGDPRYSFIQLNAKATGSDYLEVISSSTNSYSAAFTQFKASGDPGKYVIPPLKLADIKGVQFAEINQDSKKANDWELKLKSKQGERTLRYEIAETLPNIEQFLEVNGIQFEIGIGAEHLKNLIKSVPKNAGLKFSFSDKMNLFSVEVLESETKTKFAICPLRDSRFKGV